MSKTTRILTSEYFEDIYIKQFDLYCVPSSNVVNFEFF